MEEKHASAELNEDRRAPYETPRIDQSAGFERVMLGCTLTSPQDEPPCIMMQFSAPM